LGILNEIFKYLFIVSFVGGWLSIKNAGLITPRLQVQPNIQGFVL